VKEKKIIVLLTLIAFNLAFGQNIDSIYPDLKKLCEDLHIRPELSLKEEKTSERIGFELRKLGYEVTEKFGGYGVVGIMKNGGGKTLLIRTDMDALPIEETTSLPFTSVNKGAMHACGHDIHMSVFVGAARLLSENKNKWKGTVMMIAQPAEEIGKGAKLMLDAGLYQKFGVPDYALAIHVSTNFEAGSVAYCPGNAMSSATSLTITVKGIGGHGATPQFTVDPIVLAAQMILTFQTIVSREISPFDPAVVTVGYIKGGTKHNIIPSEVEMGLTIRSFNDDVKGKIISSIKNKAEHLAASAGLPKELYPIVQIPEETPSVFNNPELTERMVKLLRTELGENKVIHAQPWSASEDFSQYGRTQEKVPSLLLWVGAATKENFEKLNRGEKIPFVHSPNFNPDYENTIKTGLRVVSTEAFHLLSN